MDIENENNLNAVLSEIETIIAELGNYNCNAKTFSKKGRQALLELFQEKITAAKNISQREKLRKAG